MINPKITVVTVCYNAVGTIEKTILSVINQTYVNIEYIIVDGASTDGTVDIIKKYEDHITKWISEPDNGIYDAMNKGISIANGDFVYFLGADDVLIVNILDIVNLFSQDNILYGNIKLANGEIICHDFSRFSIIRNNVPHQAIFYPKSVFAKTSYYTKYRLYADWFLNIECVKLGYKRVYVNSSIALYNDNGLSGQKHDMVFLEDFGRIIKEKLGIISYIYFFILDAYRKIRKNILMVLS